MIRVNLTGRLTQDPEFRSVSDGANGQPLDVCQLRIAARDRRGDTVYLDVSEWGPAGRAAARCLSKGSMVAFSSELRYREWEIDGVKRQHVSAVGHVEFLGGGRQDDSQPPRSSAASAPVVEQIPF